VCGDGRVRCDVLFWMYVNKQCCVSFEISLFIPVSFLVAWPPLAMECSCDKFCVSCDFDKVASFLFPTEMVLDVRYDISDRLIFVGVSYVMRGRLSLPERCMYGYGKRTRKLVAARISACEVLRSSFFVISIYKRKFIFLYEHF